jgi:hypothetical protein
MGGLENDPGDNRGSRQHSGVENEVQQSVDTRQVHFTLTNYVYAGSVLDGRGFRKECHEGLIAKEVYDEVQKLLAVRRTRKPGREKPPIPWPLLGFAVVHAADL